jgi:general secretion pathway protein G
MKTVLLHIAIALLTFIMGITVSFSYQAVSQSRARMAREARLRSELFLMRRAINQYVGDYGSTPDSLSILVASGYLQDIPVDPMTGQKDWRENIICFCAGACSCGILEVNSATTTVSLDSTPYSKW